MSSIRTTGSRLCIRFGGGWSSLFGVPFLGAGLWTAGQILGAVRAGGTTLASIGGPVMAVVALLFVAVGGMLVFGRRWVTIDTGTRSVQKQWGWLWPMYTRRDELDGYTFVTFGLERGDSDSPDRFPVALVSPSGGRLVLARPTGLGSPRPAA